jgi:hypothetical protein
MLTLISLVVSEQMLLQIRLRLAHARTGFVIKLGGCPLIWKSQLQTLTALSTAESEYIALSHAMRILIPIQSLLQDLFGIIDVPTDSVTTQIRATVFEDNSTALQLAKWCQLEHAI